jgi:peptidyl-prolyl cis-trans isomerase D
VGCPIDRRREFAFSTDPDSDMTRFRSVALASLVAVAGCDGLREAMTAHVDVAARAEGQELSVQRLADLMGKSQIPIRKEAAKAIADLWVSYQLLGKAGARGDSLADSTLIDEVMWPVYTQTRTTKWYEVVSKTWAIDTSNLEQRYSEGGLLSAKHILFQMPAGQEATGSDSVRRRAESVLRQTTSANFAAMAKRYGSDGTKDTGGDLGVFPPAQMVPEFAQAVAALKPGEIGPLVKTQFGYHIVRRNTFAEARDAFRTQFEQLQRRTVESTYVAGVEQAGKIQLRPNAAKTVKEVAADLEGHRSDRTVIATSIVGDLTGGELARWVGGFAQPEQTAAQLQQAPDSMIPMFVKNLIRNQLFLRQADSARVALDTAEIASIRTAFKGMTQNTMVGLRVAPHLLADSAKTTPEKERLAASRVDGYLERLLQQQEGFVEVQAPLANALREQYDGRVNASGLTRAVELAEKIRAAADSARAAQQPKSAVPMPGAPGDTGGRGRGGN